MPSHKYLLLKSLFSCFIIIHLLLRTCIGKKTPYYPPSSCGNIPNISDPFRLKNDPRYYCGDHRYELTCENNTTLYLDNYSHKYIVRAINYDNYTIRLTDPSILENDTCSLPKYSISMDNFEYVYDYPYNLLGDQMSFIITFMTCPFPVNNSLLLKVAAADCGHENYGYNESDKKHTYIRFGYLNGTCIMDMCTINLMVMTSLPLKGAEKSVSISEIHNSLLYGFQLSWANVACGSKCMGCSFDGKRAVCVDYREHRWCDVGRIWQFSCGKTQLHLGRKI
ncbi:hypothetical protein PHJA_000656200 [Phtheirospermum japonicum]|uniref:Wall-associated receptor kinase galacturonan-binding domain-containing protein n=1 Tax=Phtheirospermum japonicum TaxID=374723 RepID=A0A830BK84_9LAMI|nr:hypothetical protein PHJA_000656200 [Phtheirospermum japonicum]